MEKRKHFHFKTCKITFNCTTFTSNIKGFKSQIQETDLGRKKRSNYHDILIHAFRTYFRINSVFYINQNKILSVKITN